MFNVWIIIMQSLNIKERKLTEKMSKFQTQNEKKSWNVYKMRVAHLQCMNNYYAKFEYKGIKTVGVTDYTNQTHPTHFRWKKCLSSTPVKLWKYLSNVHKIEGAHLHYVNNHYAKFECKGMKTISVTVYTNLTPPMHLWWKKCLSSTPVKNEKYLSNVHKIDGAHLQCMNNQYAKFEYKRMKTIWVTDYTNLTHPMHFGWKNV